MFTASTAQRKSGLPTLIASASSASSVGRPSRISDTSRWNSVAAGWDLPGEHVEGLHEAVPRPERARHDGQHVEAGRASSRCAASARSAAPSDPARTLRRRTAPAGRAQQRRPSTAPTRNADEDDDELARADAHARRLELGVEPSLKPRDSAKRLPNFVTRWGSPAGAFGLDTDGLRVPAGDGRHARRDLTVLLRSRPCRAAPASAKAPHRPARRASGHGRAPERDRDHGAHRSPWAHARTSRVEVHATLGELLEELRPQPVAFRRPRNFPSSSMPAEKSNT